MLEFKNAGACGPDHSTLTVTKDGARFDITGRKDGPQPGLAFTVEDGTSGDATETVLNLDQVVKLRDELTKFIQKNDTTLAVKRVEMMKGTI